ncbi:MAG TPA: hypothetical protein VGG85_11105 [Terracidiphilus sp.]|jgi:hypothetical protein
MDQTAITPKAPKLTAVSRCTLAFRQAFREQMARAKDEWLAQDIASKQFRKTLPRLSGEDNIRDFIACVAQGVLLEAIEPKLSSSLLYAAQVALYSLRRPKAEAAKKAE